MKVSTKDLPEFVMDVVSHGLVPFIVGSPGIGKSDIVRQVAKKFNLKLIDFRLGQCDQTDLLGYPSIVTVDSKKRSDYAPPLTFPLESDSIPEGYDGWLIFFDEMNVAGRSLQAIAYKVLLDRMIGEHKLHPNVVMVAAGNLETDNAVTNRLSTAMQSRLIHFELEANLEHWVKWANDTEIDYRIISFLQFKPGLLHKFNPEHDGNTFSCPRTWEFLSKIIKSWKTIPVHKLPVLIGTVGEGAAREFHAFVGIMESLPSIDQLLANPDSVVIPKHDPGILFAIAGVVSHHITEVNADTLMKIVVKLPIEFQVICLGDVIKKDATLFDNKSISDWRRDNAKLLLSSI